MRGFYRLKQGEVLQRLTAAKGFGQRDAGGVEPVKAEILRNTLERMNGAERRSPIRGIQRGTQLVEGRICGIFHHEARNERVVAKTAHGIGIVAADAGVEFFKVHSIASFPERRREGIAA